MAGECTSVFTDSGFEREVLRSEVPVLVDFWGDGCPPARDFTADVAQALLPAGAETFSARESAALLDRLLMPHTAGKSELAKLVDPHL
jgi:thiol-disulfide isomerase/thioredoxin